MRGIHLTCIFLPKYTPKFLGSLADSGCEKYHRVTVNL